MREKTLEFETIREISKSDALDSENIDTIKLHYDRNKNKVIAKITYKK